LTLQDLAAGTAILIALFAFLRARGLARRLERLSESYWELRYEHGQLKARLNRLEGTDETTPAEPPQATHFVPLSSLKK
jgi:hypothetical protein